MNNPMSLRHLLLLVLGISMMAGAGSSLTAILELHGWRSVLLAVFAFGILLCSQAAPSSLAARVARLEAELKAARPDR